MRKRRDARFGREESRSERGVVSIEVVAYAALLLLLALLTLQISFAARSAVGARNAARSASRIAATGGSAAEVQSAADAALPQELRPARVVREGSTRITVTVRVPILLPGLGDVWSVSRVAEMPPENG